MAKIRSQIDRDRGKLRPIESRTVEGMRLQGSDEERAKLEMRFPVEPERDGAKRAENENYRR